MAATASQETYLLGHSDEELARLERQAQFFDLETREALLTAGVTTGMRVLDVGCGAGDVTRIAADIVGPHGAVLGIDRAQSAVETARRRASAVTHGHMRFEQIDIEALPKERTFDAVIGRFVLMHAPVPSTIVRHLLRHVVPRGLIAFLEMDIGSTQITPPAALFEACIGWIVEAYKRGGYEPAMGSRLYAAFTSAGLEPALTCVCRVEGGPDASGYDFIAQSIRSLVPAITSLGIATTEAIGIDTLADRLRREAATMDRCVVFPRFFCAWARNGHGDP